MDAVAASSINHSDMIENKGAVHNQCLDFFKGLACIFVVFIHVIFPEPFESLGIYTFGSAAVPLFFMIAGYYLYHEDRAVVAKRIPKRARKILFYAILYYVLYAIFEIVLGVMNGTGGVLNALNAIFPLNWKPWACFVAFSTPFFGLPAWYLWAMVYCYLVMWVINRFQLYRIAYCLIPILLMIHLSIAYSAHWLFPIAGVTYDTLIVRNWLLDGLPYVLLGNFLARNKAVIVKSFSDAFCLSGAIGCFVLCFADRFIYDHMFGLGTLDRTVFTMPAVALLFMFAIKNPTVFVWKPMAFIGAKLSLFVYIIHSMTGDIFHMFFHHFAESICNTPWYPWISPVCVVALTLLAGYLFMKIKDAMKKKREVRKGTI